MFLTTEPSLSGKNYNPLRVVFATAILEGGGSTKTYPALWDTAIENALGKLHTNAMNLGADGVIGVHVSTSTYAGIFHVTVMGTAIKFY